MVGGKNGLGSGARRCYQEPTGRFVLTIGDSPAAALLPRNVIQVLRIDRILNRVITADSQAKPAGHGAVDGGIGERHATAAHKPAPRCGRTAGCQSPHSAWRDMLLLLLRHGCRVLLKGF